MQQVFNDSKTPKAIKRVYDCLKDSVDLKYLTSIAKKKSSNQTYSECLDGITNSILKLHGLHNDNFDVIKVTEGYINQEYNIADNSNDANSNKNELAVKAITSESKTPFDKILGYRFLYREMKEIYGSEEATKLSGEMYDFSLAMMDSTQILIPYCYAMDASSLLTHGRKFGQLHSKPVNRLASYIGVLNEIIHSISNHIAGAIAVSTFFMDVASVLMLKENISLEMLKTKSVRKYIENCFQSFVHSVNSLSRQTHESPFTNISVFSPVKLRSLLGDEGRKPYWTSEDGKCLLENTDEFENIVNYILEIQRIFMDFFDKGDPLQGGINYRFPVVTVNVAKKEEEKEFFLDSGDEEFVKEMSEREIYRYNIMVSMGSKTASCCRLLSNKEMMDDFAGQVNSFGGSAISMGSHRVVTVNLNRIALETTNIPELYVYNNNTKETLINYYKIILEKRLISSAKILKAHKSLMKKFFKANLFPYMTNGWMNLNRMFSTIGIIGIYEAALTIADNIKADKVFEQEFIEEILGFLNDVVKKLSKEYEIPINIEQIPGETMAVKLCKADKLLYGEDKVPYTLYSNQFVPLWEDVSIWERMKLDGKYNQLLTGGGIVHFNLGEKPTKEQIYHLIEHSINTGSEHFALNPIYSRCENYHVSFGDMQNCSVCGSPINEKYTRIVGFFTPVSSWVKERREWEFIRRRFKNIDTNTNIKEKSEELEKEWHI